MTSGVPKESECILAPLFGAKEDGKLNHLFEESAALDVYDTSCVNLAAGCPGPDLLSRLPAILAAAAAHRMEAEEKNNSYMFQYGPTAGLWGLRCALAEFLSRRYADPVDRSCLVLTCGATHGLHLLVSTLLAPGAVIFVEEYTYMIALSLFREFPSHQIVQVPLTEDGINVDKFQLIARQKKLENTAVVSEEKPFWAMLYTIPSFHNPTGSLLSPEAALSLAIASDELGVLVVCDDVYNLLHYDDQPPRRVFSAARDARTANVISNGSFSKILAPGLRVGWLEMAPEFVLRLRQSGLLQSGGSVNNVMFGLVQSVLELGMADRQLDWYRQVYKERMATLAEVMCRHAPPGCRVHASRGGYFLWLQLPEGVEGGDFLRWGTARGCPGAVPAARFSPAAPSSSAALRLSIGFHGAPVLARAGRQLADSIRDYMAARGAP